MNFNMITNRHNQDGGYISLVNINLVNLPGTLKIDNYTLLRKNEFHISLISLKQLDGLLEPETLELKQNEIKQAFLDFEKSHDLSTFKLTGEYRLVKRGDKVTIVAMADVANLNELFDALRTRSGLDLPTPPTHITIYTLQPEVGIGLTSQAQIENDSQPVNLPDLADLQVV